MKAFCLPRNIAEKIKEAARLGEWKIESLWDMTSDERNTLFSKYVDRPTAVRINAGFEQAMASKQQNALKAWVEGTFVGKEVEEKQKKDIYDKIENLSKIGFLKVQEDSKGELKTNEAGEIFLNDLVEESLGIRLTPEQMTQLAEKVNTLRQWSGKFDEMGIQVEEYWKARRDIDNFVQSLTPSHRLAVATGIVGRASMLFAPKSALLNVESNLVMSIIEKFSKNAAKFLRGQEVLSTPEANKLASNYRKRAISIMARYGYDITRVTSLSSDLKTLGEERRIHSQGAGITRKLGRIYEDIVFNKMLSVPDVAFSAMAFSETARLWSMEISKKSGVPAEEIFRDALAIYPKTKDGKWVRTRAIADAEYATYQNKSWASETAMKIREVLNNVSGDLRLGDTLMPFVKTPANVAAAALNTSILNPITAVKDTAAILKGAKTVQEAIEKLKTAPPEAIESIIRKVVVSGMAYVFMAAFMAAFDPDDFIGLFPVDQKERDLMYLQNGTPNSIKMNGKWISLDYFGILAAPLLGQLYMKKYGNNWWEKAFDYVTAQGATVLQVPGLEETYNLVDDIIKTVTQPNPNKTGRELLASSIDFLRSRIVPGIIGDIAKMTDQWERDTNSREDIFGKTKAGIPGLRQTLEPKENVLGDRVKTEKAFSQLLFGSRFKTAAQGKLLDEILRLHETGNAPAISDVQKTSPRFESMKAWLQKVNYKTMVAMYQREWVSESLKLIETDEYKQMAADEQAKELNKVRSKAMNDALEYFDYEGLKKQHENK